MDKEEAKAKWETEVFDNVSEVDPEDEHYWKSLAYGFFLGCGFHPDDAHELTREVDY